MFIKYANEDHNYITSRRVIVRTRWCNFVKIDLHLQKKVTAKMQMDPDFMVERDV